MERIKKSGNSSNINPFSASCYINMTSYYIYYTKTEIKQLTLESDRLKTMKTLITLLFLSLCISTSAQVTANAGVDKEICILDTLKVTGTGLNAGDTGSYQWKDLGSNAIVSTSASFSLKITSMSTRNYGLIVTRKTYNNTYYAYDTIQVLVNALPTFSFNGLPPRCYNDGALNLTSSQISKAYSGDKTITQTDIRYYQLYKNPSWVTGGPVGVKHYVYDFPKFITNSNVPATGLKDTICYDYTDYKGCYNKECKPFRLNPNPVVELKGGVFCQRAGLITLDNLVVKPFNKAGGIQSFRCISVPAGSGVNPDDIISVNMNNTLLDPGTEKEPKKSGEYIIEYCFKNAITGCMSCDTSTVEVIKLPVLKFSSIPKQCINFPLLALDSFLTDSSTGKRLLNTQWQTVEYGGSRDMNNSNVSSKILNSVKNGKYFDSKLGPGQYLVKVTDTSSGCPVSDSIETLVNGLPIIDIDVPDTVCSSSAVFTLSNIQPAGPVGTWSGQGVTGRNFDPGSSPKNNQYEGPVMIKFEYTNPLTNCTASDSESLLIQTQPNMTINAIPQSGVHYKVDFSLSGMSFLDTTKATFNWNFGSSGSSTSVNPKNIFYADSGTHTAYVTLNYGTCDVLDSITFTLNYLAIDIQDISKLISFYPNPVKETLSIDMPFDAGISVCDVNGRQISTWSHEANVTTSMDLSLLHPGVYLVSIRNNQQVVWKKIVVE